MESNFVIEILAGLAGMLIVAMVLVVWLLRPRPAGIPIVQAPRPPVPPVKEREPAFYQGVNGVLKPEVKR